MELSGLKKDSNKFKSTTPYDHRKQIYLPNRDDLFLRKRKEIFGARLQKHF